MARQYVVTIPGHDAEVAKNASKAADLVIGDNKRQPRGQVVSQLARMNPGETTFFNSGASVQVLGVIGDEDEEDEPAAPPVPDAEEQR